MKKIYSVSGRIFVIVAITTLTLAGCSNTTEPTKDADWVLIVDDATGHSSIDFDQFRSELMERSPAADSFPEIVKLQEVTEACNEMLIDIKEEDPSFLAVGLLNLMDEEATHDSAMKVALALYGLKEALPESTLGNFKDAETDSAWHHALGPDDRVTSKQEAWLSVFHIFEYAVKEFRTLNTTPGLSNDALFVTYIMTGAAENDLMSLLRIWPSDMAEPEPDYLNGEDLKTLIERARSASFSRRREDEIPP